MDINFEASLDKLTSCLLSALAVTNQWTTDHPYFAAGGLLLLSLNPELLLTPLRFVGRAIISALALLCVLAALPFQLLAIFFLWLLGFRRGGVERDSFAAHHQSLNYRGYIPPNTLFSRFQSYGATHHDPVLHFYEEHEEDPVTTVLSWLASLSAIFILGKEWGLWDVQVAANKLM